MFGVVIDGIVSFRILQYIDEISCAHVGVLMLGLRQHFQLENFMAYDSTF